MSRRRPETSPKSTRRAARSEAVGSRLLRDQRAHAERLGRLDKLVAIDRRLYELDPSPSSASAWTRHLADRGEMEEIARVLTTVEARTPDPRSLLSLRRQLARRLVLCA